MNPFKRTYSSEDINLFRFLAKMKLFESLTYEELYEFVPHMYLRSYKLDEIVFFRKDPSNALYVIKNGQISLNIDVNGKFEPLTSIRSGEAFGDNALLPGARRIYTSVVVSESADLYVIPQMNIEEIFDSEPRLKAKMMTSFAELYNIYTTNLFKAYRSNYGFFDLAQAYSKED